MKKSTLSLAIGLLLACSTGMAKTQHLTLEQRMALLEERLEAAEMRAAKAEGQVKQLQTQQAARNPWATALRSAAICWDGRTSTPA